MNRSGTWINNLKGEAAYKSFRPAALPPEPAITISDEMLEKLINANTSLGKLEVSADLIPNMDLFISMYVRKEALLSSQIEGTQCTLEDLLDPEINTNLNTDVSDVINYIKAVNYALKRLDTLPLCNRLLRETHKVLMSGVRGQDKNPGEFRRSQNWIGAQNCTLKDARYIPPNVTDMGECMSELERYMNTSSNYDPLIRTALIHYQFETIHPFLDGNGRIGRLLILLYLMQNDLLTKPVIYISYFLKKNQVEYYDRMAEVRRNGNYEQWVVFFLEAVNVAAVDAIDSAMKLSELHERNLGKLPPNKTNLRALFDFIEQQPIISIGYASSTLGISYNTAAASVNNLIKLGILQTKTNGARNRVFVYEDYLEILRQNT